MKLILVRHGRSIANHKFKHQGKEDKWKDTKLSNVGKFQAKELSNRLKEEKIDLIYSSPLKRAKQTAEIINNFHNKKILFDPRLKEKSDFENKEDFIKRVESLLNELKEENKTILFVTHGGVILTLLAISTGDRKAGGELINKLNYSVGNCSISIIEREKENYSRPLIGCMDHDTFDRKKERKIKKISKIKLNEALELLDKLLGKERVRNKEILKKIYKHNSKLFLGTFVRNKIVGVITGFEKENYVVISEIAVSKIFNKQEIGTNLIKEFKKKTNKEIRVGSVDESIGFYKSLKEFKPFLQIQCKKKEYKNSLIKDFNIIEFEEDEEYKIFLVKQKYISLNQLKKLRKKFKKAYFQYIFIKPANTKFYKRQNNFKL